MKNRTYEEVKERLKKEKRLLKNCAIYLPLIALVLSIIAFILG